MIMILLFEFFPFYVYPSSFFCDIELGGKFLFDDRKYLLLERDAVKVKLVRYTWWTKYLWGRKLEKK